MWTSLSLDGFGLITIHGDVCLCDFLKQMNVLMTEKINYEKQKLQDLVNLSSKFTKL